MDMELEQTIQLESIFGQVTLGIAILDSASLRVRYANPFLRSLLDEPWCYDNISGRMIQDMLPRDVYETAYAFLQQVATTGERICFSEVPYEGFIESRGRTYWRVAIESAPASLLSPSPNEQTPSGALLVITVEDMTEIVRSRLHLNAIHHISAVIAGPSALPQVLERILQALGELVGARRCAIFLIDTPGSEPQQSAGTTQFVIQGSQRMLHIAAFKGIHPSSQAWNPPLQDDLLINRVGRLGHALIITDTSTIPEIVLPSVDDHDAARRPGSVLCVPIFEPYRVEDGTLTTDAAGKDTTYQRAVLGTIEVYHRRSRGFPDEEVKLLERFAQQAGLAIHNARLFRSIDRWARAANRNARQKENVMRTIPDGIVICDSRWCIAEANPAARHLFGWPEDIIGATIQQAMVQGNIATPVNFTSTSIEELEKRALHGRSDEIKIVDGNGQTITISCSYTPIQDEVGDIFAFIILYHDITQEVTARERVEAQVVARTTELAQRNVALQRAKTEQEQILARLPSGVILISALDHTITVINEHAQEILAHIGLLPKQGPGRDQANSSIVGMNFETLFRARQLHSPSGTLVSYEEQPLSRALSEGKASEAELHLLASDGQTIDILLNAAPLRAPGGAVTSAVVVMHEITQVKALERAREDFFTTMAHELKTPLANIRAHLSALLARDLQWSLEEQHDFLQTADEQVDRLVGMINHFLDASRVEADALRLELEPILLPEMFEDLQDRLEALIASSQRQFSITLPPQVPAVVGDYELIMSVLINLLSNAFRFAPEGDVVYLEAELVAGVDTTTPSAVTLRVTDHGPGMSLEQQGALFTRFSTFAAMSRPDSERPGQPTQERRQGSMRWSPATGLGLYISRGIIEAHGSTLKLQSSPGQGASFAFTLPIYKERTIKELSLQPHNS